MKFQRNISTTACNKSFIFTLSGLVWSTTTFFFRERKASWIYTKSVPAFFSYTKSNQIKINPPARKTINQELNQGWKKRDKKQEHMIIKTDSATWSREKKEGSARAKRVAPWNILVREGAKLSFHKPTPHAPMAMHRHPTTTPTAPAFKDKPNPCPPPASPPQQRSCNLL